jgi:hypothetical protein
MTKIIISETTGSETNSATAGKRRETNDDANNSFGKEKEKKICVNCNEIYELNKITFEQRLIDDKDFCGKCWTMIMAETEDENTIDYNSVLQKHTS